MDVTEDILKPLMNISTVTDRRQREKFDPAITNYDISFGSLADARSVVNLRVSLCAIQ
jgi:hypothetical protein